MTCSSVHFECATNARIEPSSQDRESPRSVTLTEVDGMADKY